MRNFALLSSALLLSAAAGPRAPITLAPLPNAANVAQAALAVPGDTLLPSEQIEQVLNRLTFGPRPGDVELVRNMGVGKWIDWQLHPERIDDRRTDALVASYGVFDLKTSDIVRDFNAVRQLRRRMKTASAGDTAANERLARRKLAAQDPQLAANVRATQQLVGSLQSAKLARATVSNRQLDEVMVAFWENHFSVFSGKGQTRLFLMAYDRDVIRPNALGNFRDLLGAVAKSPAMLFFLDNWQSAADSAHPTLASQSERQSQRQVQPQQRRQRLRRQPLSQPQPQPQRQQKTKRGLNENYARELMELHTLGVDGGYTQKDVQEVARALTGWTFDRRTGAFVFNPAMHDAGAKTILGQQFPAGHGQDEGERVLDLIARQPATAHFIATKLARYFVADDPPAALVDRCANVFSRTSGDIRETVRCVITSPEMFSRAAYRAKVKTPFQVVASALRAVNAQPDTTPRTAQLVALLGQPIYGRQTPDGWPDRADAWMNTGAILNRINFGLALAAGQLPGARLTGWPQFDSLRTLPRAEQVDGVIAGILGGEASAETRQVLMSGDNPMLSSADRQGVATDITGMVPAMDDDAAMAASSGASPADRRRKQTRGFGRPVTLHGLAQVVGLALGAPEFQRR